MKKLNLLGVILVSGSMLFACSSNEVKEVETVDDTLTVEEEQEEQTPTVEEAPEVEKEEEQVVVEEPSQHEFKVGDTLYYYQDDEVVGEIVITNISWTDYRNEFTDKDLGQSPVNVLRVDYEYTNLGVKDWEGNETEWMFSDWDFDVYNDKNRKLETYPTDNYGSGMVSKGRTGEGSSNFAVLDDCKHFELEAGNVIIKVDLQ